MTIAFPRPSVIQFRSTSRRYQSYSPHDADYFLHQVETTVQSVLQKHNETLSKIDNNNNDQEFIMDIPNHQREALGVARHLNTRLKGLRKNQDCPRCWMQQAHCICQKCPAIDFQALQINRLFLLMHHKEIAMKVDTAKLLMAAFPEKCRLVVAGIGPDHQESMKEMLEAINNDKKECLVLFPDDSAKPIAEIIQSQRHKNNKKKKNDDADFTLDKNLDLVVIDGTWAQARKIHSKYIPLEEEGGPIHVQLSQQAVETLEKDGDNATHQLRRHSTHWRQVGTFEATRLFLRDLDQCISTDESNSEPVWKQIENYQDIANQAARRELGPPRVSTKY